MIGLQGIDKSFGGNRVLHGVDVVIPEGSVTALIGPSGSGKSTLLRCVNLLEIPEAGVLRLGPETLAFDGRRPARDAVQRIRRQTGMVFQNFQLFPHQSVIDNVMEGLVTVQRWDKPRARARAMELLEKVGMTAKADAWPVTLSGGQQQRVAIARALAIKPKLMLFDEPTSALDPELRHEVLKVMRDLAEEGMTMIVVTHEMEFARKVGSRLIFIDCGKIAHDGPPAELLSNPPSQRLKDFLQHVS